ncbi:hypothetical protein TNCV_2062521 [Trichonephila clavipes]|nr:hypothetical protein TNCV_2062521 [Trichonephila clavipes]
MNPETNVCPMPSQDMSSTKEPNTVETWGVGLCLNSQYRAIVRQLTHVDRLNIRNPLREKNFVIWLDILATARERVDTIWRKPNGMPNKRFVYL